ncbi:hypothetical protein [Victivallis sp. Marseille-Q1083]|uniref:hypothetical protein n=1 Tax=Victivallis sp. Marseille-Q1083 TaxID=2717288 RepID=UPI00158D5E06|nr:hypothetical protein [Victivallis sp. Marseille-Q1083]
MKTTSSPPGGGCRGIGTTGTPTPAAGPKPTPFYQDQYATLYCGDCREIVAHLDGAFVFLLPAPPYSRVVDAAWDKLDRSQLGRLLDEIFQMVRPKLAHNAAIYVFAWPSFAGKLEHIMSRYFNVLQHIVWNKQAFTADLKKIRPGQDSALTPASFFQINFSIVKTVCARK